MNGMGAYVIDVNQLEQSTFSQPGIQTVVLAGEGRQATWTPDGHHVTYLGRGCEIMTVNRAGANRQKVADTPCFADGLAWSPDGRLLAYSVLEGPPPGRSAIFVLDSTSGNKSRLADAGHITGGIDAFRLSWRRR